MSAAFGWRGVTGDFVPIFEPRWRRQAAPTPPPAEPRTTLAESGRPDFPQYLGPQRNGVISDGPPLASDWQKEPPQVLWRQPIGTAWSGFAIVGNRAVTLEQREQETVTCLDVLTGNSSGPTATRRGSTAPTPVKAARDAHDCRRPRHPRRHRLGEPRRSTPARWSGSAIFTKTRRRPARVGLRRLAACAGWQSDRQPGNRAGARSSLTAWPMAKSSGATAHSRETTAPLACEPRRHRS